MVHWKYTHKGKEFHYCNICNRWTVSHWRKTHKKRSERGEQENGAQRDATGSYLAAVTGGIPFDVSGAFHLNVEMNKPTAPPVVMHLPHLVLYLLASLLIVGYGGIAPAIWFTLGYIACAIPTLSLWSHVHGVARNVGLH